MIEIFRPAVNLETQTNRKDTEYPATHCGSGEGVYLGEVLGRLSHRNRLESLGAVAELDWLHA